LIRFFLLSLSSFTLLLLLLPLLSQLLILEVDLCRHGGGEEGGRGEAGDEALR
jgi:hypothetical protein